MENQPNTTIRTWGYYRVLHTVGSNVKVKELTVEPGKSLSMQKHQKRKEYWFVAEGIASVYTNDDIGQDYCLGNFEKYQQLRIDENEWHQLCNKQETPLKVIEIQYGEDCIEEDIERKPNS